MKWWRKALIVLLAGASCGAPADADLRIRVREISPGGSSTVTEYYKGHRWRRDFETGGTYEIVDSAAKRGIMVDPVRREYTSHSFGWRPALTVDESRKIVVQIETRDTGETGQAFGHTVRHLITTERRHLEPPGQAADFPELVIDGWYLDMASPFPDSNHAGSAAFLTAVDLPGGTTRVPKMEVKRTGPVPRGLALWERTGNTIQELMELSESPRDESLFETPAEFRRVVRPYPGEQLSWSDKFRFWWQSFQDWVASF